MTIRVAVVDDQQLVREGFAMILGAQPDMEVAVQAEDGRQFLDAVRADPRIDVALVDIRMPVLDGLEATRQLAGPDVADPMRVVIATTYDSDEHLQQALRNGAIGFILKDSGPQLLIEAVRSAAIGDALISPSVTVRYLARLAGSAADAEPARHHLSDRELDVARAVARGLSNAEICRDLYISLSTVKTHLASLLSKLGVRNRVELVIRAYESGLVTPGA